MTPFDGIRLLCVVGTLGGAFMAGPRTAVAQERLVRIRTVVAGATMERYDFGSAGLAQGGRGGSDDQTTSRVLEATQWTLPLSISVPLTDRFSIDAAAAVTNGTVTFAPEPGRTGSTTAKLAGVGDVRVRATGRLRGDAVVLTLGANLPSGISSLDAEQIAALGVLAAPALGATLPSVGFGAGVTTGVVLARADAGWVWAGGLSYEVRGRFSPVAALSAGLPSPEFDPGNAVHVSLGTDGFLGESALSVALTGDVYTQDRVSAGAADEAGPSVRLGPTVGVEVQLRAAARRFRELTFYASDRYRGRFKRDGVSVAGTSANYLTVGGRAALPVGRRTDITAAVEGWQQTGLSVDNTLVTAETLSGTLTLGVSRRIGLLSLHPFARVRAGTIDTGVGSANVTGISGGVTLAARF